MPKENLLSISEIYAKGKESLEKNGVKWKAPPDSTLGNHLWANRGYLDSLFFVPRFLDPVEPDTSCTIFDVKLKAPIFCSPISKAPFMTNTALVEIARGVKEAGAMMMLGIGGSTDLQKVIDTGAPVVKMVKPYRQTNLIFEKVREAEKVGCVAVGMDIDHFYGRLVVDKPGRTDVFAPQTTDIIQQAISETKLPFIIKGVLSVADAAKAVGMGASSIVVSNHGRAAIDHTVPSMVALPQIVQSVGEKVTVLVDTGFKTGNDVLKAMAFGAKAVGFASSLILGWAADSRGGVEVLISQISSELKRTMAATGCPDLSQIDRSIICPMPQIWK
jgi:4-hydroxymandelate oxidase